jgi:putative transposase
MHRTLKQETTNPAAEDCARQQKRFDEFQRIYNSERPHEALDGDYPAEHYQASARAYSGRLLELAYPGNFALSKADEGGKCRWKQARCRLGHAPAHQVMGVAGHCAQLLRPGKVASLAVRQGSGSEVGFRVR